jgi:type II secretory pathway predicted ATPase ExeA
VDRPRLDPFPDAPDPALYVSREATDLALARLIECVLRPERPAALLAPPGFGKTLLLHTLTPLVPGLSCVYVPNPVLTPAELCAWSLGQLGSPTFSDPIQVLAAYAGHLAQEGGALLWLLDDAHRLPGATARWLGHALARSRGTLRLAAAALDGEEHTKVLDALGPLVRIEALARPMSADETRRYVETRLGRSGLAAEARTRCDDGTLQQIHAAAGGVPREVSAAVSALLADWSPISELLADRSALPS